MLAEQTGKSGKKDFICLSLSILFTIGSLILIALLISKNFHPADLTAEIRKMFLIRHDMFKPEPLERTLFISCSLLTPVFIFLYYFLFDKIFDKEPLRGIVTDISFYALVYGGFFAFISLVYYAVNNSKIHIYFFTLVYNASLFSIIFFYTIALALSGFLILRGFNNKLGKIFNFVSYFMIFTILMYSVFNIYNFSNSWGYFIHFSILFNTMVQVFSGKEILYDFAHQYGLYPHFIEPIFKLTGLSIFKFTLLMGILSMVSYAMLLEFLKKAVKIDYLAQMGFLSAIFVNYFLSKYNTAFNDPYFQYFPIRMLFPCISIYLCWIYFNNNRKFIYYASFVLYSLGSLWNIDSGLVVLLSWILALIYRELSANKLPEAMLNSLKHILTGIIIFISVVILFSLYLKLRWGHFPDYTLINLFQKYFIYYGMQLIPMAPVHTWNLVALSYITGLALSIKTIIKRENTPRSSVIFYLSVLGVGLFSYFVGRSHDATLLGPSYPAIILATFYMESMIKQNKFRILAVILLSFFMYFSISIVYEQPYIWKEIRQKFGRILLKKDNEFINNSNFIKHRTKPGEKVIILSYNAGIYYLDSKTVCPVKMPGFAEIVTKEDYEKLYDLLRTNKNYKVFFDDYFIYSFGIITQKQLPVITKIILENYNLQTIKPYRTIYYAQRKQNE